MKLLVPLWPVALQTARRPALPRWKNKGRSLLFKNHNDPSILCSPEELKAAAFATLASGKRHLLVSDIPLAVTTLGEACELHSNVFGETAAEMAEVYFYYGKALLEMARLESGVLGNALDGGESQMQVHGAVWDCEL